MDAVQTSPDNISLINGLMQRFAASGDAIEGLRWALPRVLSALDAEAGSLFLHRADDAVLECVVCQGPVDITGLRVPETQGLVGRAFTGNRSELVADAARDGAHFGAADTASGFVTLSTATAPVYLGDRGFGAIQAINRRGDGGVCNFRETDLSLLETLAGSLALALANVELTQAAIDDRLLRRDLDQAREAQAALMPPPDPRGAAAGCVLPARQLSGDFFDHVRVGDRMAFCQGDVAGKGITAGLLMARSIALFRRLARQELEVAEIAMAINDELLDVQSERFVTFAIGWLDHATGMARVVNCGHGPMIVVPHGGGSVEQFEAQTQPLGIAPLDAALLVPTEHDLSGSFLCLATDGITEAEAAGRELGLGGLASLLSRIRADRASDCVDAVMRLFDAGKLTTHDDATLLVITGAGDAS
ncbi:MAG: PP2C family protein-serine/threonine phosphatase [Candidatus Puniceispirillaceae bacterium]